MSTPTEAAIVGFFVAITPLVLTPGVSFALTTQHTLAGRRRSGEIIAAGTAVGIYIHAILAAVGLSAIVMASSEAFRVIRIAGAIYLVGLGLATIRRSFTHTNQRPTAATTGRSRFAQAVIGDVLNVKAASIYLTLAPQFVTGQRHLVVTMLALATVHTLVSTVWLVSWSQILQRGRHRLDTPRGRAAIDRLAGSALVALGIRTGITART